MYSNKIYFQIKNYKHFIFQTDKIIVQKSNNVVININFYKVDNFSRKY